MALEYWALEIKKQEKLRIIIVSLKKKCIFLKIYLIIKNKASNQKII